MCGRLIPATFACDGAAVLADRSAVIVDAGASSCGAGSGEGPERGVELLARSYRERLHDEPGAWSSLARFRFGHLKPEVRRFPARCTISRAPGNHENWKRSLEERRHENQGRIFSNRFGYPGCFFSTFICFFLRTTKRFVETRRRKKARGRTARREGRREWAKKPDAAEEPKPAIREASGDKDRDRDRTKKNATT